MLKTIYNPKFVSLIKYLILLFFGLSFLSIPLFSFLDRFYIITWVFTIVLLALVIFDFIFYSEVHITAITSLFLAFMISALISTALTGFRAFLASPFLNTIIIVIMYTYFLVNQSFIKKAFLVVYFACCIFGIVYIYINRSDLLSLSFTRLGSKFGDINDICVILAIGFALSFFYTFSLRKWYFHVIFALSSLVFLFLSFTCGSKIAVFISLIVIIVGIINAFGRKKLHISIPLILTLTTLSLLLLFLVPAFSSFKDRFLNMFFTLFAPQYIIVNADYSTIGRINMFNEGISLFLRRPLFGYGAYGFHVFSSYHSGWSHNHITDSLCNYGIIGTLLYHIPLVMFFINNHKHKSDSPAIVLMFLFLFSILSVALFREKFFTYLVGLVLASTSRIEDSIVSFKLPFVKKWMVSNENC